MCIKLSKIYNIINRSDNSKAIVSNFTYTFLLKIAGFVFPLITMPYLARVIGADGFGKIAFASAIMVWIQTIVTWGLDYTSTRDMARRRDDKEYCSQLLSNVLFAKCFLMFICALVLVLLVLLIPSFNANAKIIFITFLTIPGNIFFPSWFFQAIEKMKYSSILSFAVKLFFTLCVFIFIRKKEDYFLQPLFISLGFIFSGFIALFIIYKKMNYNFVKPEFKSLYMTLNGSKDIFINNLAPSLYNSFTTIVLNMCGGSVPTGKLDAGSKFVGILDEFLTILSTVFFPFLSRRIDKHKFFEKLCLILSFGAAIFLFFAAPLLIGIFFTSEFHQSILIMRILSISIIFLMMNRIYGSNYLLLIGKERCVRNTTLLASICGFITAYPLVLSYGAIGAAINIAFTRGLLGCLLLIRAKTMHKQQSI